MRRPVKAMIACSAVVTLVCLWQVLAAEPPVEFLWPQGAPDAQGDAAGDKPTLTVYLPPQEKATGTAVVICPGGGYGHLALSHEGHQIARWLNSFGVAGFILTYRHRNSGAGYGHPAPLQDAQRAIRTVRSRASEWGIKADRIGVLGFSAGGHLASTAETHFNDKVYEPRDEIDEASARPDFAVLIYPVVSMAEPYTHRGSVQNLLGRQPSQEMLDRMSGEKNVTAQTPPTFLIATWEDTAVPAENSINFYLALREAKVPAEMHVFQKGPHGFGLGATIPGTNAWPDLCVQWMKGLGLVKAD
ncbi:MAG: alpha/beta hydrolase [Sedimentisphaerales bacterium]|nr:alpha/beta hydrolase [Sedimentisphaerales bacterium]